MSCCVAALVVILDSCSTPGRWLPQCLLIDSDSLKSSQASVMLNPKNSFGNAFKLVGGKLSHARLNNSRLAWSEDTGAQKLKVPRARYSSDLAYGRAQIGNKRDTKAR